MNRRSFVKLVGAAALSGFIPASPAAPNKGAKPKINRRALVDRHRIVISKPDRLTPLTVGNGAFAFSGDITGLQTFPEFHEGGMLLQTLSEWAWHTTPDERNFKLSDTFNTYDFHGKPVIYPSGDESGGGFGDGSPAAQWLNSNPHKFDLGRFGLLLPPVDGRPAKIDDLTNVHQELDLWTGLITSRFLINGHAVVVETVAHPVRDVVAFRVTSPLVTEGSLGVGLGFSYASSDWLHASDWGQPDRHTTKATAVKNEIHFARQFDGTTQYSASVAASQGADFDEAGPHQFTWKPSGEPTFTIVAEFSPKVGNGLQERLPTFEQVQKASAHHWATFWSTGGAIDLSDSKDERWMELERRIVLSQYQTAVNSAGALPPQETGLVQNSWHGTFHLEMHWWHAAHFAIWGREDLLMRSMDFYQRILPVARETAKRTGCKGARWPKNVGPSGRESPNRINPFLTWQQPHPIHYAELIYQARPTKETLAFFKDIVLESAEFMASFAWWNLERNCYEMGPPIVAPYENNFQQRKESKNPTFDLAYWRWALGIAQQWRERLGLGPVAEWDHVRNNLAPLTVRDGIYREIEEVDAGLDGHPTMVGALGVVPDTGKVDHAIHQKTLDFVLEHWPLGDTWGWDYPMMAMAAARLGRPDQAIEALFIDAQKNRYLANGHNYQQDVLPLYLPGNGGLLFAVAMMAAGWKGSPSQNAPGFPAPDQGWSVRWEGLLPAL